MYNDDHLRIPENEDELWILLEDQCRAIEDMLIHLPLESKEDALGAAFLSKEEARLHRTSLGLIRHRNISEENDQRDYFLAMGREVLPYIRSVLNDRRLTPQFIQQWGKVMYCFGYVSSHVFDDSNSFQLEHNRRKGGAALDRTPQRVFLARLLLWLINTKHTSRQRAEAATAKAIWELLDGVAPLPQGFGEEWFRTLVKDVPRKDRIISTMEQKNASRQKLQELAAGDIDGVPPIEIIFPDASP